MLVGADLIRFLKFFNRGVSRTAEARLEHSDLRGKFFQRFPYLSNTARISSMEDKFKLVQQVLKLKRACQLCCLENR